MHCKKPLSAAIACVLFMLAGCDKTVESGNYRLHVTPSLGQINNSTVRIYAADGRTFMSKNTTGSLGEVSFFPGASVGPVVISVQGDGDATYFDENKLLQILANPRGKPIAAYTPFPSGYAMRALVPSAYGNYGVTPLTELAYRIAVDQQLFPMSVREVNELNERVREAFVPEISSILIPPTIINENTIDKTTLTGSLVEDNAANRYALRIAALALLGGDGGSALSQMQALGADILDGKIDDINFQTAMNDALALAASRFADPSSPLISAVASYPQLADANSDGLVDVDVTHLSDGSNFSGCTELGDGEASALPAEISGQIFTMRFDVSDFESPYVDNEVVPVAFCADGQLRVTGNYYVVGDLSSFDENVDTQTATYTWNQYSNGMVYELVLLSHTIYELNVYGNYGSTYYGRFTL